MISALCGFGCSMLLAVLLTPLVRKFATELGAMDMPSQRRVHTRAIPRLGGLAIVAGFFASLLGVFAAESEVARLFFVHPMHTLGLAVGGLLVCGVGVLDDIRGLRAWHKLCGQCCAAVIAYVCGFRIDAIALPFFGRLDMGVFGILVTALWIVAIINAMNLIDGLDGLAGGVAFFACVTNFVVGFINGDAIVMLLSASLGGAVLGFLLFNFSPASIFMGDSGSMFLGYVLATTSILGNSVKSSTTVAILVPLVALGLPIMDTLLAMARRFLERRSIFVADRQHLHHQLLAMGLTHRRAVLTLYALTILFTAGAIIVSIGRNAAVGAALVLITVAVVGVIRSLSNFDVALRRWRQKERARSAPVERLRVAVPLVLGQLTAARDVRDLASILGEFAERTELLIVELVGSDPGASVEAFQWTKDDPARLLEVSAVTASYPVAALGSAAMLHFSWVSEIGEVGIEADILLQLVVDACGQRVARLSEARRAGTASHLRSV
jgi:UDP-GlcNAc:undecaprenyl-phosphate GlcNAc-1-phosphate transferase